MKPKRIAVQREHKEQVIVATQLRNAAICHAAIPNAGKRGFRTAAMLKNEGMQKGFPDLLIFDSPPLMPWVKGVAIEMKSATGRASPEQRTWMAELVRRGWLAEVCVGSERALNYLASLGYRVPNTLGQTTYAIVPTETP